MTLIGPESDTLLWALVLGLAGIGFWAEQKTRIGRYVTGIIVAMAVAMLLSNLKVIPTSAPVYDRIFRDILPVAIPLLLFRADLRRIYRDGGPTIVAFLVGAVGVVAGVLVATLLVPLGELSAVTAGLFTATYTGGSANFSAMAIAADFSEGATLTAMVAADVIVTNVQTMFLIALPGIAIVRTFYGAGSAIEAGVDERDAEEPFHIRALDMAGFCLALATAYALVAAGDYAAAALDRPSLGILFTSAFALIVGNLMRPVVGRMSGDFEAGIFLIFLFLVAIAASADVWVLAETGPRFFFYAGIVLFVHTVFILLVSRLFRLDLRAVIIGSTACVGGVTTASAIASAKGWRDLVLPGILAGTLGNAIGTFIGVWVWMLLR